VQYAEAKFFMAPNHVMEKYPQRDLPTNRYVRDEADEAAQ
jgi:hypothetical protein